MKTDEQENNERDLMLSEIDLISAKTRLPNDDYSLVLFEQLKSTHSKALDEIKKLADNDDKEIERIKICFRYMLYMQEAEKKGYDKKLLEAPKKKYFGSSVDDDQYKKEFSISFAFYKARWSIKSLVEGEIEQAIQFFGVANFYLGWYGKNNELLEHIIKSEKGSREHKKNADEFWFQYFEIFDNDIARGKEESWALKKIGDLIEKDGKWSKKSKKDKDSETTLIRPNRTTLQRQLITKRKKAN